ncbi:gpmB [Symbiodinium natans]|uniref:GpmB protein n=1 Tax=Symbiodinium natans TaxID=878477 RepID=A0A812IDG6_9DINO|nr:gpmB [Symbiodinium natans]
MFRPACLADVHWASLCAGAALSAATCLALALRRSPPWLLQWLMAPEVRRSAWDALKQGHEHAARPRRRAARLYLIRHGQSEANQQADRVGGRDEKTPLTTLGERQARKLGERFKGEGISFDCVFASHAVRAFRTAQLACEVLGFLGRIEVERRVVEFSQGALEQQPRQEVYREGGPIRQRIRAQGNLFFRPPGYSPDGTRGESAWDTELRFSEFVDGLLMAGESKKPEQRELVVGVFAHGMAIKSFVRGAFSAAPSFLVNAQVDNTSITEMVYKPRQDELGGWSLVRFNDASHLRHLQCG